MTIQQLWYLPVYLCVPMLMAAFVTRSFLATHARWWALTLGVASGVLGASIVNLAKPFIIP